MLSGSLRVSKIIKPSLRSFSSSHNIVTVDFSLIKNQDQSLFNKFEEAYNDDGLGVMIINNVPGYVERRKALLPLAQKLANLPKNVLESLECPEYLYGVGWSHGREKFKGIPDFLKGSYYANP